jgi:DNA-binding transcriptional LysR family regulator
MSAFSRSCSATSVFLSVPFSEHPLVVFCSGEHRFARRRSIRAAEVQGKKLTLRELGSTTRKALEERRASSRRWRWRFGSHEIIH